MTSLIDRINDRSARIGVIGLGYVGLPLGLVFHEAGFPVLGFDVDTAKVESLARGESYIKHMGAERILAANRNLSSASEQGLTTFAKPTGLPRPSLRRLMLFMVRNGVPRRGWISSFPSHRPSRRTAGNTTPSRCCRVPSSYSS